MPRILVTGGAGFIGSRLVNKLISAYPQSEIWVLDNLHPQVHGLQAHPPEFHEPITFMQGDIADPEVTASIVSASRPEMVYHLAAETGTGQSYDEVVRYCEVNVTGTARLIAAIRAYSSSSTRKLLLAASRAVYGEGAYRDAAGKLYTGLPREAVTMAAGNFSVPLPAEALLPMRPAASNAGLAVAPASVYASTKLMQEYLLKQAGQGADWRATILRFQNVYGPGQSLRNPYTGVLSIFAKQLLEGKILSIYEDGEIARDFVYVDDVVEALVKAGQRELGHGSTLDIGSGSAVSILEVARMIMRYLGLPEDRYAITGQFRVGDIRHACADITRASELLEWTPQVDIEEGLRRLADWARSTFNSPLPYQETRHGS